jgi:hypothetical protein
MTDRAPPKGKKPAKGKTAKKAPGPKMAIVTPGVGHNNPPYTGEKNPRACELFTELEDYAKQKKAIAKAERDARNALKSECGILASSVAREMAMRKLDSDVRVQVETNYEDTKKMTGYQPSLDFAGTKPTDASVKAQPKEAELEARNTEPNRAAAPSAGTFHVQEGEEEEGGEHNVITREG